MGPNPTTSLVQPCLSDISFATVPCHKELRTSYDSAVIVQQSTVSAQRHALPTNLHFYSHTRGNPLRPLPERCLRPRPFSPITPWLHLKIVVKRVPLVVEKSDHDNYLKHFCNCYLKITVKS